MVEIELSDKDLERFWSKIDKQGPYPDSNKYPEIKTRCWLWIAGCMAGGYGGFRLYGLITILAHRIAWVIKTGKQIPPGKCVLHSCDTKLYVRHLFLGTKQDNNDDCLVKGRGNHPSGSKNKMSKLTEQDVKLIRKISKRHSPRELAVKFGVCRSTISNALTGATWRHI